MAFTLHLRREHFQFSLRSLLLLFIPVAIISSLLGWLLHSPSINVLITPEPLALSRRDDSSGNSHLYAAIRITNTSDHTIWCLEPSMTRTHRFQQLIDGKWEPWGDSSSIGGDLETALHSSESIVMFVGPISEKTTEMKVSIPFTNESISIKLNPSTNKWSVNKVKVHWVTSPTLQIVKKGKDLFAAVKQGSEQEEQVFPCK